MVVFGPVWVPSKGFYPGGERFHHEHEKVCLVSRNENLEFSSNGRWD